MKRQQWLWLSVLGLAACETDLSEVRTSDGRLCEVEIAGALQIVGEKECYLAFPKKRMSGYWVSGLEYSVYYPSLGEVAPRFDLDAPWLDFSEESRASLPSDGEAWGKIYKLTFIGTAPDRPGVFGGGLWKRGVYVDRILELVEVRSD